MGLVSLQYEENPNIGKTIAELGEFAVSLSRGEIDAENVDNVINNLDKLGLIPWDKTQVQCLYLFYRTDVRQKIIFETPTKRQYPRKSTPGFKRPILLLI